MDAELEIERAALSRRTFLGGAVAGGLGLAMRDTALAGAQEPCPAPRDKTGVASWSLQAGSHVLASFAVLGRISLEVAVPPAADLKSARQRRRLRAEHRPPSVTLERSPNLGALKSWHERALTKGPAKAARTVLLVGRDAQGAVVQRFLLRNAFPARLEIGGLETGPSGDRVERALIVCTALTIAR